jgi:hypothetical protein
MIMETVQTTETPANVLQLRERLQAQSNTALATIHNEVNKDKPVTKFKDKTTAVIKTADALIAAKKDFDGTKIVSGIKRPRLTPEERERRLQESLAKKKAPHASLRRKANQQGMVFPIQVGVLRSPMKMTNSKGRQWEEREVTLPDGSKITGHLEVKRGVNFYFDFGGKNYWAKLEVYPDFNLTPKSTEPTTPEAPTEA